MCIICDFYDAGDLDGEESIENAHEMIEVIGKEHSEEVVSMVISKELGNIIEDLDFKIDGLLG